MFVADGDEVAQRGRPRPGARDVAEEPRMIEVPDEREHVAVEPVDEVVEVVRPVAGAGPSMRGGHVGPAARSGAPARRGRPAIRATSMSTTR